MLADSGSVVEITGVANCIAVDVADVAWKHAVLLAERGKGEVLLGGDPLIPKEPVRCGEIAVDAETF